MQAVLDVRKSLREAREMELAQARAELEAERQRLENLKKRLLQALESLPPSEEAGGAFFFIQRERYLKKVRSDVKFQERKVNEAVAKADIAMGKLKEAIVEQKKMEKARERQFEGWNVEFKRDEQKLNDETASARAHMRILAGSYE
jgi:flagellar export protein FliJ